MSNDEMINVADEARPEKFSDMVGQAFVSGVGQRIGQGKISGQGYILAGPKGCGKTSAARIIARSVNCTNRDPKTGDPCNKCSSCTLALKGAHPAIEEINAAEKRGINDIKSVLSSMVISVNTGYRVYILDEIHMLTREAFSTLLKPMEQPPHKVLFIATTTNPEVIPDTIISRVPVIPVNPLSDEDINTVLHNVIEKNAPDEPLWNDISDNDIAHAVRRSQGSARQAITTLSGIIFHGISQGAEEMSFAHDISLSFLDGDVTEVLHLSQEACKENTIHPVSLVQSIMEELISKIDEYEHKDVSSLSRSIAQLSTVCSSLSSSTPALMTASQIASCVPTIGMNSTSTQKDTASRKRDAFMLTVTDATTLDDVIAHIVESQYGKKKLSPRWRSILDNPDKSEIFIDNNTVHVHVQKPTKQLKEGLESLLSNVAVSSL